ncbi:MAG: hypothetical protein IT350_05310 [Deltaproteobacteria bacterium]|nr:hypothetical protein [Deltaproteobacteria bacterium]
MDLARSLAELAGKGAHGSDDAVWNLAVRVGLYLRRGGRIELSATLPHAARIVLSQIARLNFPASYDRLARRLRRRSNPLDQNAALEFLRRRDDAQAAWHAVMAVIDPARSCGDAEATRRMAEMHRLWTADEAFFTEFAWAFFEAEDWTMCERRMLFDPVIAAEYPWFTLLPRAWDEVWLAPPIGPAADVSARQSRPGLGSRTHSAAIDRAFRRVLDLSPRVGKAAILQALAPGAAAADDESQARRFAFTSLADRLAGEIGVLRVRVRAPGECPEITGGKDAIVEVDVAVDRAGALRFVFGDGNGTARTDADGAVVHLGKRWANVKDGVAVIRCDDPAEFYRRLRALPDSLAVVWIDGRILYGESVSAENAAGDTAPP